MTDQPEDIMVAAILAALRPLENIANAYDDNELDDEARKEWGPEGKRFLNPMKPDQIELYSGRGGNTLLTLADCIQARALAVSIRKIAVVGAAVQEATKGDKS